MDVYDVLIIGGGPAGAAAALYTARAELNTLVIDKGAGAGALGMAGKVANYPGLTEEISGIELLERMRNQARSFGAEFVNDKVIASELLTQTKKVFGNRDTYLGRSVIIASGSMGRGATIKGESEFIGRGVSYCATCDGNFFRGKDVAVIGGGNTALEDAEVLANIANKVYLVHRRDQFRGDQATVDRLAAKENVEFVLDSVPLSAEGEFMVSDLLVKNVKTDEERKLDVQGIFVAAGQVPDNKDFENVAELDKTGYVSASEDCHTKTDGIFTAGDCRTKKVRQLTTAAADGAVAALAASEYINQL